MAGQGEVVQPGLTEFPRILHTCGRCQKERWGKTKISFGAEDKSAFAILSGITSESSDAIYKGVL